MQQSFHAPRRITDTGHRAAKPKETTATNPKPDAEIQSLDLEYGPDKRGVPVLLGVTAASAAK